MEQKPKGILDGKKFIAALSLAAAVLFVICFLDRDPAVRWVNSYNTTMLAFSYKYGLIPRALIGTLYQGLAAVLAIFGVDLITMSAVKVTVLIVSVAFAILTLYFAARSDNGAPGRRHLIAYFTASTVMTFAGYYNFGRVDLYLVAATMLMILLLTERRAEWLICLLCPACVLIHEAYVFLYFNVVLVILACRLAQAYDRRDRAELKKYGLLTGITVVLTCVAFLYIMLIGNKIGGQDAYDAIYETASRMVYKGKPHKDLLRAEILGVNLGAEEWEYHIANFRQLGMFLVLYCPFVIWLIAMLRRIFRENKDKTLIGRLPYLALVAGSLTTVPLFALKIDYGRWIYAVVAYYCMILLAFIRMGNEPVDKALEGITETLKKKWKGLPGLLLLYSLVFLPFYDMSIDRVIQTIYDVFFG